MGCHCLLPEDPAESVKKSWTPLSTHVPWDTACGFFPPRERTCTPLRWKRGVVTTGPPGKSLPVLFEGLVKGATEDEMVGQHHRLSGREFEWLRELVTDGEAWHAAVYGVAERG